MPVPPKPPELRQRRNRASTRSQLPSVQASADNKVPALPERDKKSEVWHPKVVEWWQAVWQSPMAAEFLDADMRGGLYLLAELHQQRWSTDDPALLAKLASEIRQQEVRFGLSPIDRRRLQWEIEKGEQAEERTASRRQRKQAAAGDPRKVLKIAK